MTKVTIAVAGPDFRQQPPWTVGCPTLAHWAKRNYPAITVPTSRIPRRTLLACRVLAERGLNVQLHSDRIMELARRAASETDSAKLLALVKELNKALVEDRARPKGNATEQQRTELERTG